MSRNASPQPSSSYARTYFPDGDDALCPRGPSRGGVERERRDLHQQREAREQGADRERAAWRGQAELVDLQGDRPANGTRMGFRQRAGVVGQRDIHARPPVRGHQVRPYRGDGLQWPVPRVDHCGTPVLHKDGCFTCGLGQFMPVDWTPPAEERRR